VGGVATSYKACYSLSGFLGESVQILSKVNRAIGSGVLALLISGPARPQTSQSTAAQKNQPVYQSSTVLRATTRLVVLDIVAVDEKGQPVPDLKADEFTVLEDGKPQNWMKPPALIGTSTTQISIP
jgi:hypothetical protein